MSSPHDLLVASLPGPPEPAPEDTQALLERARAGDRSSANQLFGRYTERLRRIVIVRLGPRIRRYVESEDLVQETLCAALASLERGALPAERDLLDWLAGVATNRIRDLADHLEAAKRDVGRTEPLVPGTSTSPGPDPLDSQASPSEEAFQGELRVLLDELVWRLPEGHREVVLLRDYQGTEWERIAERLGTPSVHAAQQLHQRAWIKLRAMAVPRLADLQG